MVHILNSQVNVSSLEKVFRYSLHLADERTEAARAETRQSVVDADDLDTLMSPEEMLLKAVSGEDAQVGYSLLYCVERHLNLFYVKEYSKIK